MFLSLYSARIYQTRYSGAEYIYKLSERSVLEVMNSKPNYLAPYKGLQGATAHTAATWHSTVL